MKKLCSVPMEQQFMTQDIGTAIQRAKDCPDISAMVYTVGNEQDYHFKVLFLIIKTWI